jgi:hypothetical protein
LQGLLSALRAGWNRRAIGIETLKPMPWLASEKAKLPMIRLCRGFTITYLLALRSKVLDRLLNSRAEAKIAAGVCPISGVSFQE